jgi:Tfp pilus assembly PilM family ATPase
MFWKNFFLKYFPTPRFLEMPFVGIDISPMYVRMVEIPFGVTLRVGKFAEQKLQTPFSLSGDMNEVKTILKQWKKKYKLNYVKVSLPEEHAYLFQKEFQFDTDEKMRQAIEIVLEENVPVNGAESIFDYRLSEANPNKDGLVDVAVTVLPVETTKKYLELFDECGLTPLSFMIEAQALSRAVIKRGDKGCYLIVNIGETKIGFFVISKGVIQFTSTISSQQGDKGPIISDQIRKVFAYWHSREGQNKNWEPVQKIILCGRDALAVGLKDALARDLVMPVEVGDMWVNLDSREGYVPPIVYEDSLGFGLAIGLALPENE